MPPGVETVTRAKQGACTNPAPGGIVRANGIGLNVLPAMQPNDEIAARWLGKLTRLNPATGRGACRGKAPHKPLLLLSLIDLAEGGEITSRAFTRSPGLVLRFRSYGTIVADRWPTRLDLTMPFFHLSTQGFWEALNAEMRPAVSPESCVVCEMNPEFFEALSDAGFRLKARMVLVTKYFEPAEQVALFEGLNLQVGRDGTPKAERVMEEAVEAAKRKGRSARFSVRVVTEYRFTCALTGYRCITGEGTTIVDAAHIEAWKTAQNDDLANGLALSKNAHWLFDEGLWSVDRELRVIVNFQRFTEHGPEALRLAPYAGRHLQFDPAAKLRPAQQYFEQHRRHHGVVI
jgi:putative restriction endonuclease